MIVRSLTVAEMSFAAMVHRNGAYEFQQDQFWRNQRDRACLKTGVPAAATLPSTTNISAI
jgi:hypothetical protein